MSEHARLSPSNHRWPHCPGSVREEANYPDIAGESAIDGTGSHLLLELCMTNGVRAESYDGQIIGVNHPDQPMGWLVSLDRIERVQQCLDYVDHRYKELSALYPGHEIAIHSESKSDPGVHAGRDDWWGTVDITISVYKDKKLVFIEVIDYKDGRGWVDVYENSQLLSYAIGKQPKGITTPCRLTIIQPKTNPVVRYEDVSVGHLVYSVKRLSEAAAKTDDPDAPLIPGKHCTWCKHGRAKNCTVNSEQSLERILPMMENTPSGSGSLFEIISETFGDITKMDSKKLEELADAAPGIMDIFVRVNAEIQRRLEDPNDNSITGYAMLPGKSSNDWNAPEEDIVKMLKARRLKKDDIYISKLISPAGVAKLKKLTKDQKDKIMTEYVEKKAGNKTLQKIRESKEIDKTAIFDDVIKPAEISFL